MSPHYEYNYIYFLVYKLKSDNKLWIVKISDSIDDAIKYKSSIQNLNSKYEKYYLIERKVKAHHIENELKFKQFVNFIVEYDDIVIKESL